jgi:hypothetical protein
MNYRKLEDDLKKHMTIIYKHNDLQKLLYFAFNRQMTF